MMKRFNRQARAFFRSGSIWALGAFLFLGPASASQATQASETETLQRLGTWMAHYYEHPEPDALPRWMQEISASGGLEKASARYPVLIFVSTVVSQHPAKAGAWCDALSSLPATHRAMFAWSFKNANAPQHERCQKDLPRDVVNGLRAAKPIRPLSRPPTTPGDLDMLWATFMASGDEQPVNMIVDVLLRPLPASNAPGSIEALLMNGAAKWSLASNAKQHARVRLILEQRRAKANAPLRQEINQLLANPRTKPAGDNP